jgi:hypothetical protein
MGARITVASLPCHPALRTPSPPWRTCERGCCRSALRPIQDRPADMTANVRKEYDRYQALVTKLNIELE